MKRLLLFVCFGSFVAISSYGQDESMGNKMALGFQLTQYQNDFGVGLNVSSPYFANEKMAVRLRGNLVWHQHLTSKDETNWSPYANMSLGFTVISGKVGNHIRVYGESGAVALFPSTEFSDKSIHLGGYGLLGFEFFMYQHGNYFIEIGALGTGAKADKVAGAPIYSNGLLINVGYRVQF